MSWEDKRIESLPSVGVIVARFQAPQLTNGHEDFITHVMKHNDYTIVFLGTCPVDERNPLPFAFRRASVESFMRGLIILPFEDMPNEDEKWTRKLEQTVGNIFPFDKYNITFYGGRDSTFLKAYKEFGKFRREEVAGGIEVSATKVRQTILKDPSYTLEFRAGTIYGVNLALGGKDVKFR